jgi:thiamine-monophosphate kinase
MINTNNLTPLGSLGEFGLIDKLTKAVIIKNPSTIKGVGDDAAVIDCGEKYMVVTTDMLTEGIHFNLVYTPLKHLGYKAVVVNLSDVYAMNAEPKQITVSIAVSSKFSVEHLEELYSGIYMACQKYNVDLVGGDTTSSLTGLTISVTAIGEVKKEDIVYRSGAKENDLICVSGNLGAAYLGLQILERERKVFENGSGVQPNLKNYEYLLERQLKPEAKRDVIDLLRSLSIKPSSMIDISDGLSSEMMHICIQSSCGCIIYAEKIPIDADTSRVADELNMAPQTAALNGGEDYEMLFTVSLTDYDKIVSRSEIHIIGHITEKDKGRQLVLSGGAETELKAQGWNAY